MKFRIRRQYNHEYHFRHVRRTSRNSPMTAARSGAVPPPVPEFEYLVEYKGARWENEGTRSDSRRLIPFILWLFSKYRWNAYYCEYNGEYHHATYAEAAKTLEVCVAQFQLKALKHPGRKIWDHVAGEQVDLW